MTLDKMLKRPYSIDPYNPEWPIQFQIIKKDLEESFGDKALSIDHVGSTSIPGMCAKPVIDVCVVIDHYEEFPTEKEKMTERGYRYEDGYIAPDTILFYKAKEDDEKTINIHVCVKGSYDVEKFLEGRDYFLAHPERVKMYKELKEKLNKEFPNDYPSYRAGKQAFLKETKDLAHEWKSKQQ
jgi:GrpB-like predicted nucleotidyltransferase (UPF0157 family)